MYIGAWQFPNSHIPKLLPHAHDRGSEKRCDDGAPTAAALISITKSAVAPLSEISYVNKIIYYQ